MGAYGNGVCYLFYAGFMVCSNEYCDLFLFRKMLEHTTTENLLDTIMDTISEGVQQKCGSFFEQEKPNPIGSRFGRVFGREEPVHGVLGGGKSAALLWRNKKISGGVLAGAAVTWVMLEWLNYNFLSLLCFAAAFGMLVQFLWSSASAFMNGSPSEVPRIQLPDEWFVNIGVAVG